MQPTAPATLNPEQAITELWNRGELSWKLKPCQQEMLAAIQRSNRFKYVIKCARRLGKSYLLCTLAIMVCLQKPGAQVRYAAPTAKALMKIVRPIMRRILADCPPELRPIFKASENVFIFPNGSEIHLAGVNSGHAEDLRGPAADLFLVDEAGSVDELHYLIHDIALPQLLDTDGNVVKGRRLVVASSPARSPAHDFTELADEAEVQGYYSHYTIFHGGYSNEIIELFLREDGVPEADIQALLAGDLGAVKSSTVRREYLAQDCIDESLAIVPEWSESYVGEPTPDEFHQFYWHFEWMDMGTVDFTVCLFALYDFKKATLYVIDEVWMSKPDMTTPPLAKLIKDKEAELWPPKPEERPRVNQRVADNSHPLLLNDLAAYHQLAFQATSKDRLHEMVNKVRTFVGQGRLVISPRCKQLLGCMRTGVWNQKRTEFARSKAFGHQDALAALVYGIRNLDESYNPIPATYGFDPQNMAYRHYPKQLTPAARAFESVYGKKPVRPGQG